MSDKCIGCGYCCHKAPCVVGQRLHGNVAPCPELMFAGGRHWCRWVMTMELQNDEQIGETAKLSLFIGLGCTSGMNSWRREPIVDRTEGPNMQQAPRSFMEIMRKRMRQVGFPEACFEVPRYEEEKT